MNLGEFYYLAHLKSRKRKNICMYKDYKKLYFMVLALNKKKSVPVVIL